MNAAVPVDSPDAFTERAVPLLKEYLRKLRGVKKELRSLRDKFDDANTDKSKDAATIVRAEFQALEQYFHRLHPAVMQFSQQVSGMIDQGKVTPLMRAELRLRLAELESVVSQMLPLLNAYRPR